MSVVPFSTPYLDAWDAIDRARVCPDYRVIIAPDTASEALSAAATEEALAVDAWVWGESLDVVRAHLMKASTIMIEDACPAHAA